MKFYSLTFSSKNKNSLNRFFLFFFNNIDLDLDFQVFKKYFYKKKKIKKLTILKSPHVNKTSQEQFETRLFSRQLNIYSLKNLKHLVLLKKIKNNLFSDISIKIKFSLNKECETNIKLKVFEPNNFKITDNKYFMNKQNKQKNFNYKNIKKIKNLIKIFDTYGELNKIFK